MTLSYGERRREAALRHAMRRQILSGVEMVDEVEARRLLALASTDLAWSSSLQERIIRFRIAGKWSFPAFQFDSSNRRLYPGLVKIVAASRAAGWSEFRLLNWMMCPHLDFDGVPADALRDQDEEVLEAFLRDSEPDCHG
ncbi:hypothetical protein D3P06_05025 [Paracoccus aestuarii]|uniref:DUF2384 domain-containing protein n=1 Tax=Paracoccus aestuarii TaxID=453842 RepID=A0A418ZZM0_9RHOB|nr:hypothetical protein [Paracoccus aestuarii]RJL06025.1 hypothetical protein D3P06_05025 [Paracoccus aestuarii]WCQ99111.1 hypothetical protein JHW48_14940 [Paracoccus aestuarii]